MLRCTSSFFAPRKGGGEVYVALGQEVEDGDPVVKGREALFQQVEESPAKPRKAKKRG